MTFPSAGPRATVFSNSGSHQKAMCAPRRVVLYDAGCVGLGHTKRCARLARALLAESTPRDPVDVLVVTGMDEAMQILPSLSGLDYLRLPNYSKNIGAGPGMAYWDRYRPQRLRRPVPAKMTGESLRDLRSAIIKATFMAFKPDLIIVDFEPLGLCRELVPAFEALRALGKTRFVFGVRDVLDRPDLVRKEWVAKGVYDLNIRDIYHDVVVYGAKEIHDPVKGLLPHGLPVHFVGYLGEAEDGKKGEDPTLMKEEAWAPGYLLVTGGGGADATPIYDWVLLAYEQDDMQSLPDLRMVYGPYHPKEKTSQLEERVRLVNQRELALHGRHKITTFGFLRADRMKDAMKSCSGLIGMCGCNTFTEILQYNIKAIVVPRETWRQEQLIRAEAFESRGVVKMLRLPPNVAADGEKMRTAILALNERNRPSDVVDTRSLLNGASQLVNMLCEEALKSVNGSLSNGSFSASSMVMSPDVSPEKKNEPQQ